MIKPKYPWTADAVKLHGDRYIVFEMALAPLENEWTCTGNDSPDECSECGNQHEYGHQPECRNGALCDKLRAIGGGG